MFNLAMVLLLAIAVSMDSLSFGIVYGIRNIKIPVFSQAVIALFSGTVFFVSMLLGKGLCFFLPEKFIEYLGSFIFFAIACIYFFKATLKKYSGDTIATLSIKPLGIVIKILKEPESADLNVSGEIDLKESIFLGIALALDAAAAGVGAATSGFSILRTSLLITGVEFLFLRGGYLIGSRFYRRYENKENYIFPAITFIILGFLKLIN